MDGDAPSARLSLLGEDRVDANVSVRLSRHARGLRLTYDDTGSFDLRDGGARIEWYPGAAARLEAARLDVLGRVLPMALHEAGTLCLHGSAVEIDGAAVAFAAPKFHGKSTLARAVANAGGRVMSDDVVAVDPGPPPIVRPGVSSVRLWRAAVEHVGDVSCAPADAYGKYIVPDTAHERSHETPVRLDAIYVLTPVKAGADHAASRRLLDPLSATMALLPHNRLASLLGGTEAAAVLDRVTRLLRHTPVYALSVVRDFDRLEDAACAIRDWHGSAATLARHTA